MSKDDFVIIHGIKYIPVDTPLEDTDQTCKDCDIFKARPPQHMCQQPLCCDKENLKVNQSCCSQFEKGIKRIWKIKSV